MSIKKIFPSTIIQFVKIYFTTIFFFFIFRGILFFTEIDRINYSVSYKDILLAFLMGVRFDIVISSYILILPFFILTIVSFIYQRCSIPYILIKYYVIILFSLAFTICAIDIPYFNQFFSRFSVSAFEWADSPIFVLKMIIQEPSYWLFVIPLILVIFLFTKIIKSIFNKINYTNSTKIYSNIIFYIFFLGLIFLGIRGRIEKKSPIRIGTAYFCNNAFLNQLGLNPNFTLIRSYLDGRKEQNKKVHLMDDSTAISNVQHYLNIQNPNNSFPLYREIEFDSSEAKHNVVLIIMESMSAGKMKRHGNTNNLTPFLDSISRTGYYFENTYSAGIHTFNGVFSTLFSYPALFRQHSMKESAMQKFHGAYSTLKENGYSTIYFTTHDGQFDNVEGFLKANDCEMVITQADYPTEEVKTTLGVPDDYMFEFSIPILNKLHQNGKPFFSVFMTASDHGPYYLPDYYKPRNSELSQQMVEYADFSLKKMIDLSSKEPWFKNTIFIFIADHGASFNDVYDISLNYNHVPLIFYAPHIFKDSKTISDMAGQIDVFPTLMGLLKIKYGNYTLGIDLLREKRPYIFFNADNKYGVIDNEWLLIVNTDNKIGLYKYQAGDTHDYADEMPEKVEEMNIYAKSNLQAYQYILSNKKL